MRVRENILPCVAAALVLITVLTLNASAGGLSTAPGQQVPTVEPPTISGTAALGQTLTASYQGSSKGAPVSYAFQWEHCAAGGCSPISGATDPAKKLGPDDVGYALRVSLTAANKNGSVVVASAQTSVVAPPPAPAPAPPPPMTTQSTAATISTQPTTTLQAAAPSAPPSYSSSRFVYCLGEANWSYLGSSPGWWYEGTSTGWTRDAGDLSTSLAAQRIAFDNSVSVMQTVSGSYGQPGTSGPCQTVRTEVRSSDPQVAGVPAGAQASWLNLVSSNATNGLYGSRPTLVPQQGQDLWYGFAFATNPGYTPQRDPSFPNWNVLGLEFHSSIGGLGPLAMQVATSGPSSGTSYTCNTGVIPLAEPKLEVVLTGGDVAQGSFETASSTCRRYQGPTFRPGHLYRVIYHVRWDAFENGTLQVWIDGNKVVDATGVSTLWRTGSTADTGTWPQLQNYRKATGSQSTNVVYYGGVVRGSNETDVTIP